MRRSAIVILLVVCGAFLFAQEPLSSRKFVTLKKSLALAILNNHPGHFHVLRFNKLAHDMTIERRAKPSAEITGFTPLKLDSVNASWFDYEQLDYLFFERDKKVYFLFEKELNNSKTVYLKVIDSTGRASGFIELLSLEKDRHTEQFDISFRRTTGDNILLIASKTSYAGIRRKEVSLFDLGRRAVAWTKKLPLESVLAHSSSGFECSAGQDLFYLLARQRVVGYSTFYSPAGTVSVPELQLDSLFLVRWGADGEGPRMRYLGPGPLVSIHSYFMRLSGQEAVVSMQCLSRGLEAFTLNKKLSAVDLGEVYSTGTEFDTLLLRQLTFYDGPFKEPFQKPYSLLDTYEEGNRLYSLYERVEGDYYKELVLTGSDLGTGRVLFQKVIPRKLLWDPLESTCRHASLSIL